MGGGASRHASGAQPPFPLIAALAIIATLAPARAAVAPAARAVVRASRPLGTSRSTAMLARSVAGSLPDPYDLVRDDIAAMKQSFREVATLNAGGAASASLVATSQPVLTMAVQEFLKRPGKSFRPMVVLLVGRVVIATAAAASLAAPQPGGAAGLKAKHVRLAELTEMMNIASLIHDDVLDDPVLLPPPASAHAAAAAAAAANGSGSSSVSQPHAPQQQQQQHPGASGATGNLVHQMYSPNVGNKVSILAGDFLLARAAVELARLEDPAVVEIMAGALESIVRGGMLRAESLEQSELTMAAYTARTYARSAQLVSNACRCAALLAGFGHGSEEAASAAAFGAHLGMAHAIMADVSEFRAAVLDADVASAALSGPPSLVALLALARQPGLADVVGRTARTQSDIQRLVVAVRETGALKEARALAATHSAQAAAALLSLADCEARGALTRLCTQVLQE